MSSYGEMDAIANWLMWGGGTVGVFGVLAYMLSKSAGDRGGLSHIMAIIGGCIFFLGLFMRNQWGTGW